MLPTEEPKCGNCHWAHKKNGKEMVTCGADLPPFAATWPGYRKTLVSPNYVCALFKLKQKEKVNG